jgi:hypothetical protein
MISPCNEANDKKKKKKKKKKNHKLQIAVPAFTHIRSILGREKTKTKCNKDTNLTLKQTTNLRDTH